VIHWLHSLLPDVPHYGYVLVFIVVFLNNVGFPLPGETILLGAGFVLGQAEGSLWLPMAAGTGASFGGKLLEAWLGPMTLYLILAAVVLIIPGVIFRHSLSGSFRCLLSKNRPRR
jgi:membrane protein DedA with SNARE-associated domain